MKYAVAVLLVLILALGWDALAPDPIMYVTCRGMEPIGNVTCSEVKAVGTWTCDEEGLTLHVRLVASEIAVEGPMRIRWNRLPTSCQHETPPRAVASDGA